MTGFGNLELSGKYQLLENDAHEAIVSLGLGVEVGGTGSRSVGADPFSTWAPGIFFGKGFGDLPESLRFLKPLALTGWPYRDSTSASAQRDDGRIKRRAFG